MQTNHVTLLATLPWRMLPRPSEAWPVLVLGHQLAQQA